MTEDQLQIACNDYMNWQYPEIARLFFHVPNGGSRNIIEAAKLKRMGVKAGILDCYLDIPRGIYHGFRSELKVGKNKPTVNQKEVMQQLKDQGYYVCVCYTLDEFIKEVEGYLNG